MQNENNSEVARLMAAIKAEYEAGMRGISGLAHGASKHEFITKRMENIALHTIELDALIGEKAAMEMIGQIEDDEHSASGVAR